MELHGNKIPSLGLGTYSVPADQASDIVYNAIKIGYRHIDCASYYKNEAQIGEGIQKAIKDKLVSRQDLWLTSKLWNDMHSREDVLKSLDQTLKDLKVDYLDLYLVHWPFATTKNDPPQLKRVPLRETWEAMESLHESKKVRNIGVSNFENQLLHDMLSWCKIKPYANQIECHIYLDQKNIIEYCVSQDIYVTAYSPLGNYSHKNACKNSYVALDNPAILEIAKTKNKLPCQILLRWLLQRHEKNQRHTSQYQTEPHKG